MIRFLLLFSLTASLLFPSCSFTQKIKDGRTAHELKQYEVATRLLEKEYNKTDSRVEKGKIAFLLGDSYKHLNRTPDAITWFRAAYDYQYGVDALRELAYALKYTEQYEEARQAFKDLGIEIGSPYEYRKEITACNVAIEWQKQPNKEYTVDLAGFNSRNADYAPSLYENGQLVFTSDRASATGDDTYHWTGQDFSDLFVVDPATEIVQPFDPNLNSTFNEGTAVFNKDFTEVYFTRCFSGEKYEDNFCKLMMSQRSGAGWTVPVVLNFVEDQVNYGHPALSDDGERLYFSSNHPDGWGGYDLYYAERNAEGWDPPVLLGRSINTPRNEQFPFVDGDTLYFASEGHTGMGGLDIFRTYEMSNGNWSNAQNLKPPLNSGGDDFGYVIYSRKQSGDVLQEGYFTSTRIDGLGNDDIYHFQKRIPPPEPVEEPKPPVASKMILEGYVLEKIYADPFDPNSKVLGRKPLGGSTVEIDFNKEKKTVTVGDDGFFTLELEEQTDYQFFASHEGYLNEQERFSTKGIGPDPNNPVQTFEIEIVLDKIFTNVEITLENIYYDFDRWEIREDARPTLDELARNLQLNPDIRIQLASHTDCRGTTRYNEELSQKRAQSAVDYLISKGIAPERLIARGFGENVPAADCICNRCTEEQHQENRRTTFAILE